jgi:release factor glutamine methyltransferase
VRIPDLKAGAKIDDAIAILITAFRNGGIESAQADARILVADALSLNRAALLAQGDRTLDAREIEAIAARATRRLAREPVDRILGSKEFWSLPLRIAPAVLSPRPDTETVVGLALDWIATRGLRLEKLRMLDIGTGSGALLLALLAELPNATGTGTDISVEALAVARDNAERLGFAGRSLFVQSNFADALGGPYDLIISNPPYIRSGDIPQLEPEVRSYDPLLALDGGADGLDAYRAIVADTKRLLAPAGRLIVELGQGQEADVTALLTAAGLTLAMPPRKDLNGISRALCASAP